MKNISRRSFIQRTALTSAALTFTARSWSLVNGANSDIRIGVIGFHGRGETHIDEFKKMKGVRITALCDVDKGVLNRGVDKLKKADLEVTPYADIRKLLENKDIDAISIATPNHWHALAAIWGIQAGKDVYLEKPVSHNVWEGRQIVRAAEKYKKVIVTGTQSRSSTAIAEAVDYVQKGNLGKLLRARGLCYKPRTSIGKTSGPQQVPDGVDYDLWSGPAPLIPPHRNNPRWGTVHYDWHWIWNYGNGDLGNQGIHQMDIARWFLGEHQLSPRVFSIGGRVGYVDDGETPNSMVIYHDYKKAPLIFEVRGLPEKTGSTKMDTYKGADIGVVAECENGYAVVTGNYTHATIYDKDGKEIKKFEGGTNHFANFITAVRSRKMADNKAPIAEGHISSALCHTGNISYRVGKQKNPDEIREAIKSNKDATETFNRMSDHLAANNVDLTKTKLTHGQFLKMDPKTERFSDSEEANALLKDKYREPFVVPDQV
ncbi:MAG: oxidoreductase domain protein [Verrucomicrobiales bacterium]|nr:oxidoreductase domain protein [Verrucomicrobiales bacterium]